MLFVSVIRCVECIPEIEIANEFLHQKLVIEVSFLVFYPTILAPPADILIHLLIFAT